MQLLNYDFYDLYALLIFFRMETDKISEYAEAVQEIVACLEQPVFSNVSECNTVRKILQKYFEKCFIILEIISVYGVCVIRPTICPPY